MTNEVTDMLDALHAGAMTLEQVADSFRRRQWPDRRRPRPESIQEMAAAELLDPDVYVPGSYDDVVAAYDRGRLTDPQYAVLARAIADAQRRGESNV
jgi:hypothetical protein